MRIENKTFFESDDCDVMDPLASSINKWRHSSNTTLSTLASASEPLCFMDKEHGVASSVDDDVSKDSKEAKSEILDLEVRVREKTRAILLKAQSELKLV